MPLYRWGADNLDPVSPTTFEAESIQEADLQRLLRDQPEVLEEGLFIIAEEYSNWQDSSRSIDLLALDESGRLVVIELKRTGSGDHSDLQAIRYAAMVSNMTLEDLIDAHGRNLRRRGIELDSEEAIHRHLERPHFGETKIDTANPRIILVSAGFSTELTTSVLWLNDNGLDIACMRLNLYRNGTVFFMDTEKVIPLREAGEYQVQIRRKQEEERGRRGQGRLVDGGGAFHDHIPSAPPEFQKQLLHIFRWAEELEERGLCGIQTFFSKRQEEIILLPRLRHTGSGLANIYSRRTGPRIQFFRSVYESQAPNSIERIEKLIDNRLGQGNWTAAISDDLLEALTGAHHEANGLPLISPPLGSGPGSLPMEDC